MSGSLLLLFVFLSAFLAPPLSRLLRMPVPVGELVIGLLLGHFLAQGVALPEILGFWRTSASSSSCSSRG